MKRFHLIPSLLIAAYASVLAAFAGQAEPISAEAMTSSSFLGIITDPAGSPVCTGVLISDSGIVLVPRDDFPEHNYKLEGIQFILRPNQADEKAYSVQFPSQTSSVRSDYFHLLKIEPEEEPFRPVTLYRSPQNPEHLSISGYHQSEVSAYPTLEHLSLDSSLVKNAHLKACNLTQEYEHLLPLSLLLEGSGQLVGIVIKTTEADGETSIRTIPIRNLLKAIEAGNIEEMRMRDGRILNSYQILTPTLNSWDYNLPGRLTFQIRIFGDILEQSDFRVYPHRDEKGSVFKIEETERTLKFRYHKSPQKKKWLVHATISAGQREYKGLINNCLVVVGDKSVPLTAIKTINLSGTPTVDLRNDQTLTGKLPQIEDIISGTSNWDYKDLFRDADEISFDLPFPEKSYSEAYYVAAKVNILSPASDQRHGRTLNVKWDFSTDIPIRPADKHYGPLAIERLSEEFELPTEYEHITIGGYDRYICLWSLFKRSYSILDLEHVDKGFKTFNTPSQVSSLAAGMHHYYLSHEKDHSVKVYSLAQKTELSSIELPSSHNRSMRSGCASVGTLIVDKTIYDTSEPNRTPVRLLHTHEDLYSNMHGTEMRAKRTHGREGYTYIKKTSPTELLIFPSRGNPMPYLSRTADDVGKVVAANAIQQYYEGIQLVPSHSLRDYAKGLLLSQSEASDFIALPHLDSSGKHLLLPTRNLIVSVNKERVSLVPLNLDGHFKRLKSPYLFIKTPERYHYSAGQHFLQELSVFSSSDELKYTLLVAPEGMSIGSDGVLSWEVPDSYIRAHEDVVIEVRAEAGLRRRISYVLLRH